MGELETQVAVMEQRLDALEKDMKRFMKVEESVNKINAQVASLRAQFTYLNLILSLFLTGVLGIFFSVIKH